MNELRLTPIKRIKSARIVGKPWVNIIPMGIVLFMMQW